MLIPYYRSRNADFTLLEGDCTELLPQFNFRFDMIFADPPYFLSNGGISYQAGKVVCVDKGDWDKADDRETVDEFNRRWIKACRDKLQPGGTIWISGTYHNIFSVERALEEQGFRILNVITWAKTNPPPNISCRFFTYSTEFIIWARRERRVPHRFNYSLMRDVAGGKQMTDVWQLPAIARWEKVHGKHPTQKPLSLLCRIIMSCTQSGAWVLDPFSGSGTTGIAAAILGRRYLGIDRVREYLDISRHRRDDLDNPANIQSMQARIRDITVLEATEQRDGTASEPEELYRQLPF